MRGWVWLARARRWIGCGDMQDGILRHYQEMVPLSDWAIEKRVEEAMDGDRHPDLFDCLGETGLHPRDSEGDDPPEG